MATLLEEPRAARTETPTPTPTTPTRLARARAAFRERRASAAYVLPLLVLTAGARLLNMGGAPQRIDDEGTYTAQAWAVQTLGELGHYTFWYDHPPLGWIQIAGWTSATGAFARHDVAVLAGREAMVAAAVVSAGLLWLLGRRLGLSRPGAALAVGLFALSPLAVQFTRTVYLDNVATPWVLAAFVLALSRHRQLAAFAGAAACFAVAVLTKETYLLLLPFLAWQLWRSSEGSTRRYTLSVSGAILVLTGVSYALFALVKGELVPGAGRVSLYDGIAFQLVERDSSGSVLDATTQAGQAARTWLDLGPVLVVGGLLAAVLVLLPRLLRGAGPGLRPYAAALLFLAAVAFKPGYLPVPYVIALLPLAALLIGGVVDAVGRIGRRSAIAAAVAGALVVGAGAPSFAAQAPLLWGSDLDRPLRQAETWAADNVADDEQVLVDDASWLELVRAGLPRRNVVWYYKADTDPEVTRLAPDGWSDYEYAVVTQGMRQSRGSSPVLDSALANGITVATFGDGDERVDVVRVLPNGTDAFYAAQFADRQARGPAGQALLTNDRLSFAPEAADALRAGEVDSRAVTFLALVAADHDVEVSGFPVVPGEAGAGLGRRTVTVAGVDGQPVDAPPAEDLARDALDQTGDYAGVEVERTGDDLTIRFPVAAPEYLLPGPAQ